MTQWLTMTLLSTFPQQDGVTPQASNVVCYAIASSSTTIIWPWVIYLLWNTVMLVLMAIPAYKTFQLGGNHKLSKVVYQDGLIYYSYLFVLSLINIVVIMTTPPDIVPLLSTTEVAGKGPGQHDIDRRITLQGGHTGLNGVVYHIVFITIAANNSAS
ncbi:hypothetical protein NLJ89_g8359 [Agrocybe chaxingu]|uniref:Uncharacterized protein n=1 Tax=Agrocybe chaxingu TaxID=84603 RepID=A0A9W8JSS1_9AGAR|nr:hypothetical protein NLJ89_g8359 [Agrocybe chaxingu]